MSVILIRPAFQRSGFDQDYQESLGMGYLAAVLRERGHAVRIVDAELTACTVADLLELIDMVRPRVVGLSLVSHYGLESAQELVDQISQHFSAGIHLTLGGHLPSFAAQQLLDAMPGLDSVVQFEAELVLPDLVERIERGDWRLTPGLTVREPETGRVIRNPVGRQVQDLDALPFPARDTLPMILHQQLPATIVSARGCVGACSFCSARMFSQHSSSSVIRFRSPKNVVAEIEQLIYQHGVHSFHFIDDDFIGNNRQGLRRAREIARHMQQRGCTCSFYFECRPEMVDRETFAELATAGLRGVFLGVDSVRPQTLALYNKRRKPGVVENALRILTQLRLEVDIGFIPFHPGVSFNDITAEYAFLQRHGLGTIQTYFNRLFCAPGSPLTEQLERQGLITKEDSLYYGYEFSDARVRHFYSIAEIAIKPFFQTWYGVHKQRHACKNLMHQSQSDQDRDRFEHYDRIMRAMNHVVTEHTMQAAARMDELAHRQFEGFFEYALELKAAIAAHWPSGGMP